MKTFFAFAAALIVSISALAIADEPVQFNIINLRVEQSREVGNDVMVVVMQAVKLLQLQPIWEARHYW